MKFSNPLILILAIAVPQTATADKSPEQGFLSVLPSVLTGNPAGVVRAILTDWFDDDDAPERPCNKGDTCCFHDPYIVLGGRQDKCVSYDELQHKFGTYNRKLQRPYTQDELAVIKRRTDEQEKRRRDEEERKHPRQHHKHNDR